MKILVISGNPFSLYLNNGKTYESILSAFNKEEICQLFVRPVSSNLTDFDFCNSMYCVSDADVINKITCRKRTCGAEIKKQEFVKEAKDTYYKACSQRKFNKNKNLLRFFRDFLWNTNVWKNKALDNWLEKETPNIIFISAGGESFLYNIALYVSEKFTIPIIYYVTDDYLITVRKKGCFDKLLKTRLEKKLKEVICKSSMCYAIGEKMANVYSNYFGKKFDYIMNSVPVLPYNEVVKHTGKLKVSYFGSLSLNREKMIARFASMTKDVFECNVYVFDLQKESPVFKLLKDNGVIIHPGVIGNELHCEMYKSDILLHVESDDPCNRAFTRLAISTKIPEYLMHCRPIIGFGPTEVASMQIISENNIGVVVSSNGTDKDCLIAVSQLLSFDLRQEFVSRGYNYALKKFNRDVNAKNFRKTVESIIN